MQASTNIKKIILLVEDNEDDQALTLRAFEKSNIANQIIIANDGEEAVERLFNAPDEETPTLVLLDLKLPKMDGLEVLQRIRASQAFRTLPVVILTSSKEEQDLIKGYTLGANSYIRKPIDFNQFMNAIQQLGLYWLVLNEMPPLHNGVTK